jgi:hypothetical protein
MPRKLSPDPWVRAAWAFATLIAGSAILLAGRPSFTNASKPPGGIPPVLAIQLVRTAEDVDLILGEAPSPDREVMRMKLYADFALIAGYTGFFAALGVLAARGRGLSAWAGIAGAVCGASAGAFDLAENRAILAILEVPVRATSQAMLDGIRFPAVAKWILIAIAGALFVVARLTRLKS